MKVYISEERTPFFLTHKFKPAIADKMHKAYKLTGYENPIILHGVLNANIAYKARELHWQRFLDNCADFVL